MLVLVSAPVLMYPCWYCGRGGVGDVVLVWMALVLRVVAVLFCSIMHGVIPSFAPMFPSILFEFSCFGFLMIRCACPL